MFNSQIIFNVKDGFGEVDIFIVFSFKIKFFYKIYYKWNSELYNDIHTNKYLAILRLT